MPAKQTATARGEELLTVSQTAKELGTLVNQIYLLLWSGRLEGHKRDGRWYVVADSVRARMKMKALKK